MSALRAHLDVIIKLSTPLVFNDLNYVVARTIHNLNLLIPSLRGVINVLGQ